VPYGGGGAPPFADPCARLATWLHVPGNGGDRQGAALYTRERAAPHRPFTLPEWIRGGVSYKDRTSHPKFKAKVASSSLLLAASFDITCSLGDGLCFVMASGTLAVSPASRYTCWATYGTCHCMDLPLVISTPLVQTARPRGGGCRLLSG
jgi:hypothetical protein